jgi:hypothetical protein
MLSEGNQRLSGKILFDIPMDTRHYTRQLKYQQALDISFHLSSFVTTRAEPMQDTSPYGIKNPNIR